jgi:hypothetical protein
MEIRLEFHRDMKNIPKVILRIETSVAYGIGSQSSECRGK